MANEAPLKNLTIGWVVSGVIMAVGIFVYAWAASKGWSAGKK